MFVGHYGPSFLAKRLAPQIPLWTLFIAVQLLDVFWSIFVFLGVERVRIVPGFTKTNALDLYYMPYTHSLPGAVGWAVAAAVVWRLIAGPRRGAALVGAAVFSHWPLDLIVHRPDLALYDDAAKVGLGLWDYPYVTLVVEGILLLGAMAVYLAASRPLTGRARYAMPAFGVAILLMQASMAFGPPPPSDRAMAATALIAYTLIAASIAWLERGRTPKQGRPAL
jgi:hypothetical protein